MFTEKEFYTADAGKQRELLADLYAHNRISVFITLESSEQQMRLTKTLARNTGLSYNTVLQNAMLDSDIIINEQ